jgi:REP element-mobilizing transposase RayT
MNLDDPLAYFITWTVYGTHLQGDEQGWIHRNEGHKAPQPNLVQWRKEKLKHPIILLNLEQRAAAEEECRRHCELRGWRVWALNARSNHCHIVVTSQKHSGAVVRDQLKANGTRRLREQWPIFQGRPVWTVGGDWKCINNEDDLETVCSYVLVAQDRKDRDQ